MSGYQDSASELVQPIDKCGNCGHYKSRPFGEHGADHGGRCGALEINRFRCWDTCLYFVKADAKEGQRP